MKPLEIQLMDGDFSVCKLAENEMPDFRVPFCFYAATDAERSLVCRTALVPSTCLAREDGWRMLRVAGQLDFSLTGILAKISSALSAAGVALFAVSTYDTDYVLVKRENLQKSREALCRAGFLWEADALTVRKSCACDLPDIFRIYDAARSFMASNGNPTQWGAQYPPRALTEADVALGRSYVCTDALSRVVGVFVFFIGEDPTYQQIDGAWKNDTPYGVIHRIASDGTCRGVTDAAFLFCFSQIPNLRADTHRDNRIMQQALLRNGFLPCGTIVIADGTERLAYQKTA